MTDTIVMTRTKAAIALAEVVLQEWGSIAILFKEPDARLYRRPFMLLLRAKLAYEGSKSKPSARKQKSGARQQRDPIAGASPLNAATRSVGGKVVLQTENKSAARPTRQSRRQRS